MSQQKTGAILFILLLMVSNAFTLYKLTQAQKETRRLETELAAREAKSPIEEFNQLFVDKVLKAQEEVSFETRLELENKVRELRDEALLAQWNKFVNAQAEAEAQAEVKGLLSLLAERMND